MQIIYRAPESEKEFDAYFYFRWRLLRKPLGLALGSEQDELEKTSFHMAAYRDNKIISCARLQIETDITARIRYMAVKKEYQGQGIGSCMLQELEKIANTNNVKIIWLYARESAISFYQKNGYSTNGVADSELTIKHQRMEKTIKLSDFF